ncbi:hypothetical protein [Pseudonocardia sp. ICBG162]|uniref:hypothetical protein n=1 Tax=Pseudonocardia sp. ICBG162 TaxID=2846761 RepID=UPI001CF69D28|nr:hypothetical protein [Pseudonocardia sp. ICBG162]
MVDNSGGQVPGREVVSHLLVPSGGQCWRCQSRPASTGEHKFKRANLSRLMKPGDLLLWGDGEKLHEIRGKSGVNRDRYGVVKFPKSMCEPCNNQYSREFDLAYDKYSVYIESTWVRVAPGFNLHEVYGEGWAKDALNLARYFAKHFGCRMAKDGIPIPASLREFLAGATDMPDARMSIISTDSIHRNYGKGMSISPNYVWTDDDGTRFTGMVAAAYVRSIGVRYEWQVEGIPDELRSQFFDYPYPVINFFRDDDDMARGITRKPGRFARFMQWANTPPGTR